MEASGSIISTLIKVLRVLGRSCKLDQHAKFVKSMVSLDASLIAKISVVMINDDLDMGPPKSLT